MVTSLIFNLSSSSCASWIYFIILKKFFQFSLSSPLNLVHKNSTVCLISGLDIMHRNNASEIVLLKTSAFSTSIFVLLGLSLKNILLLGSSQFSLSLFLPCKKIFQFFINVFFNKKFSFP